jgi:hypothetical protein
VGPAEDSTLPDNDREHGRRKGPAHHPRTRTCLLKGCERRFHPRHARQRYCSDECRQAARRWSRWKAQQSYRATAAGKERRNRQGRRYRERVKNRQKPGPQNAVPEAARVITTDFFRPLLRPTRLLREIGSSAAVATAALLFTRLPARPGTCPAAGAALAPGAHGRLSPAPSPERQISPTY